MTPTSSTQPEAPIDLRTRLPKAIKTIVHNRDGWTLQRLAAETGITYNRLCNHLNGKEGGLSIDELVKIIDVLELTLAQLEAVATGKDPEGLLLSAQLHLAASNPTPESSSPRSRPTLTLV